MRYPIVIHKDPHSDYGAAVPDLPGCFSAGETMDEALTNAVEAIECHLEGLMLDGEPLPTPTSVEHHQGDPEYFGGIWALVDVDLTKLSGKARRVNITIPERVLSLIDDYALRQGETRSGLITQAALEYIAGQAQPITERDRPLPIVRSLAADELIVQHPDFQDSIRRARQQTTDGQVYALAELRAAYETTE